MTDPGEDICNALIQFVSELPTPSEGPDQDEPQVSLAAKIRKTDNPLGEIEHEVEDLLVLMYPSAEAAEKRGRGGECIEEFTVSMLVIRKMDSRFTRSRLSQYVREIKAAVRGVRMAGYIWSSEDTTQKYDIGMAADTNTFASVTDFIYMDG